MYLSAKLVIISCLFVLGCGGGPVKGGSIKNGPSQNQTAQRYKDSIQHDGVKRTYHVRLPANSQPEKAKPLVVALHGGGGRGGNFDSLMTNGTLGQAADARSVVLVYPNGVKKQWNDGRLEILRGNRPLDDVGFIATLIDTITKKHNIDESRVYVTGISNGGHMSIRLAVELSHRIAAIAPVVAQVTTVIASEQLKSPISVMFVNGTNDPLVPFNGGDIRLSRFGRSRGEVLSAAKSAEFFKDQNRCTGTPTVQNIPDRDPNDETRSSIMSYGNCNSGTEVKLVTVEGGGHTWPGGKQYLRKRRVGTVSRDFNASDLILDFILSHRLAN